MTAGELRTKFLDFMKSKGHTIIPSASLVPENDSTTLFTSSGMQPMIPYLLGEKHPLGKKITDSQKSFRTVDIDDVGDNRHTTFFEMLGNWSLGDYFKKEQIEWIFEFLTKELGLDPKRIYVTVFRGKEDIGILRDEESVKIWQEQFAKFGISAKSIDFAEKNGMQDGRIFYYDETKNWWSRSGIPESMPIGEPGGPDSEMFWDFGDNLGIHENSPWANEPCHVNCDCGRFVEMGNNVFMEYIKTEKGFELLKQKNVDYGGGLERQIAAKLDTPDIFLTDIFSEPTKIIEKLSRVKYADNKELFRVVLDHLRAATFLICDGVYPCNKDQGYFVRRLIRRAVRFAHRLGIEKNFCREISEVYIKYYIDHYTELTEQKNRIFEELEKEENNFRKTLEKGLVELEKMFSVGAKELRKDKVPPLTTEVDAGKAFYIFQTFGFPLEMMQEELKEKNLTINTEEYNKLFKDHQEKSRTASAGMFKGGLADSSEETKKLHTTAHLLLAALRKILGDHVVQKGSNITAERLRFDFSHPEKMTPEQIKKVDDLVNEAISKKLPVECQEMTLDEAKTKGAMGVFESKYGEKVKVYTIGEDSAQGGPAYSREICGGPHVENTGQLGRFKITKEESSSAGVRRIKAVLE